jgi:hypothetical protein
MRPVLGGGRVGSIFAALASLVLSQSMRHERHRRARVRALVSVAWLWAHKCTPALTAAHAVTVWLRG